MIATTNALGSAVTNPEGKVVACTYDPVERRSTVTDPDGGLFTSSSPLRDFSGETVTTKDTKSTKMEFDDLSTRVIGCAIEVHRQPGPGLLINFNVTRLKEGIKRFVL